MGIMAKIETIEQLQAIYGEPVPAAIAKVADRLTPQYRAFIEAAPFLTLATCGPEGLDCSPRGDKAGSLLRIIDDQTLILPDRRGNNRIDSLRNIVRDARIALLFLIPGSGNTIRINGRASLSAESRLLKSFAVEGKAPRCVIIITIESVYFQCARAILRAELWNADLHIDPKNLPSAGQILARMSDNRVGGTEYDRAWAERAAATMW